jgi:hypothetical protein
MQLIWALALHYLIEEGEADMEQPMSVKVFELGAILDDCSVDSAKA